MDWMKNPRLASFWHFNNQLNKTECELCPRHCQLKKDQMGFCKVRGNVDNKMYTFNFGKSVQATEESIETEAVYHYRPGSKILSMGNVGCMMACSYCQNWQTSQIKHLDAKNVSSYTPQQVVDLALDNNIGIISWTYNDPVVWQEFVVETSRIAQANGIRTLYKSAFYIETKPIEELIEVIDIFSISLKSMSDEVYKKITKGSLAPVLKGIEQIGKSGRHLEISQLIVPKLNDDGTDAKLTSRFILDKIGNHVPLHFVAYHPAYRYNEPRTPLTTLLRLRDIAKGEGIKYCYLGNVYAENVSNTFCQSCNNKLVERFGLTVNVVGLNEDGHCNVCNTKSVIVDPLSSRNHYTPDYSDFEAKQEFHFTWDAEVKSLHIVVGDSYEGKLRLLVERFPANVKEYIELNNGLERAILSKSGDSDQNIKITADRGLSIHYLPVLDRAHFPVVEELEKNKKYLN